MLCNNFLSLLPRKHQGQQRHRVCFADLPPMTLWVHIKLLIICKYISPLKRIHKHDFIDGGIKNKVNLKIDNNKNNSLCKNKKTQIKILKRPDILFYYKKKISIRIWLINTLHYKCLKAKKTWVSENLSFHILQCAMLSNTNTKVLKNIYNKNKRTQIPVLNQYSCEGLEMKSFGHLCCSTVPKSVLKHVGHS